MSLMMGSTIAAVVWTSSVQNAQSPGGFASATETSEVTLAQGTWLVVWNLVNLHDGIFEPPPPAQPPVTRPLFFDPQDGIFIDPTTKPSGVTIAPPQAVAPHPDQAHITQWRLLFTVDTDAPTSVPYVVNLVDAGGSSVQHLNSDPTILVETDPIPPA